MKTFQYTITKFDQENKSIVVAFDDGGWAEIRLTNPLPQTKEDLERIIKQFTAPLEAVAARLFPDADLNYINELVGKNFETERFSIEAQNEKPNELSQDQLEILEQNEQKMFEKNLCDALVKFGVLTSNPLLIDSTNI